MRNIKVIIESLNLPTNTLKKFLTDEVDELINADGIVHCLDELDDVLFSISTIFYHKTGSHRILFSENQARKMVSRLGRYGTLSKNEPESLIDSLKQITPDILHFAFPFPLDHNHNKYFKNGSEEEIQKLIKAFPAKCQVVINFQKLDRLKVSKLSHNVYLVSIPNFIYTNWKPDYIYEKCDLITQQLSSVLSKMNITSLTRFHFHSWESGMVLSNPQFLREYSDNIHSSLYSPYLPVMGYYQRNRENSSSFRTISEGKAKYAVKMESLILEKCQIAIVESKYDCRLYQDKVSMLKIVNYSDYVESIYLPRLEGKNISFIAGGRAVPEKGFHFLIMEFKKLSTWANKKNIEVSLEIYCIEESYSCEVEKGEKYIRELKELIHFTGLSTKVNLKRKVPMALLEQRINNRDTFIIISSLYDPFNLIGVSALKYKRPLLSSIYAGFTENIQSPMNIYDPKCPDEMCEKIIQIVTSINSVVYQNTHEKYNDIYA